MPKIVSNHLIREAIANGMRYENGQLFYQTGRIVRKSKQRSGYFTVTLGPKNHRRTFTVARVICWLVYGPPPTEQHEVDHINCNRSDDRPENLRWVTVSENIKNTRKEIAAKYRATLRSPKEYALHTHVKELLSACAGRMPADSSDSISVESVHIRRIMNIMQWEPSL